MNACLPLKGFVSIEIIMYYKRYFFNIYSKQFSAPRIFILFKLYKLHMFNNINKILIKVIYFKIKWFTENLKYFGKI